MLTIVTYKVIHITGLILVFMSLGAVALLATSGGSRKDNPWRVRIGMCHGIGLFLLLLSGFGMLAKLGLFHALPIWVMTKLAIWLLIGAALTLTYRCQRKASAVWWMVIVLGIAAAYLGIYKP